MGQDSKIEWTDDTVNPWWGCTKVSPACSNCYADTLSRRFGKALWGPTAARQIRVDAAVRELEKVAQRSDKENRPRRVFIASMADVFEDRPDLVEPRKVLWDALHRLSGRLTPLLLTKRPEVMAAWAEAHGWPAGAWAGTTVEDQRRADERIPHLLRVPAAVRFLSMEPLLAPVDVLYYLYPDADRPLRPGGIDLPPAFREDAGIGWIIVGGESGPGARPLHPDWVRSLRGQCQRAGVPFFFKQWGEWAPNCLCDTPKAHSTTPRPKGLPGVMFRCGKHGAGRLLDERTWDEVPR